jgi:chorismate mutase/prephenate dehydratase
MQNDKSDKLDLTEIRNRIDNIDDKLVKLLEERLDIVSDVAKYKKANESCSTFDKEKI